jgi:hypothetical protein
VVDGTAAPDRVDQLGFLTINGPLRHYHLNTALGAEVLRHLQEQGVTLSPEFIARLRAHHALEG